MKTQWIDRKAMAVAAGVSVRTLFNYKNAGTVTAWRVTGKNRIEFNASKVLAEISKHTGKASTPATGNAQPKKEKPTKATEKQQFDNGNTSFPQNELQELRKTVAHLEARIAKLEQAPAAVAPARNVTIVQPRQLPVTDEPKATGGEWSAHMARIRDEREEYLKNRVRTPEELKKEAGKLKPPTWQPVD